MPEDTTIVKACDANHEVLEHFKDSSPGPGTPATRCVLTNLPFEDGIGHECDHGEQNKCLNTLILL